MSEARTSKPGGRSGGREGRIAAGRGRRRSSNFRKGSSTFKNPIPSLKDDIIDYGKATCPARFEETWGKLGDYRRQTGSAGAAEVADAMESFVAPVVAIPPPPPAQVEDPDNRGQQPMAMFANPNLEGEREIWKARLALIPKLEQSIKQQMNAAFVDTWESCHPMMKAKLKALPNYQQINADKDVIQLGLQIRAIACGVETSNNKVYTTVQLSKMLHLYHQDKETSDHQYLKNFEGLVRAIEQQGGTLCQMPALVDSRALQIAAQNGRVNNVPTDEDVDLAESQVNDEIKAAYFLSGAYFMKHGNMRNDLNNLFLTGNRDAYPKTVADAMRMMEGWRRSNPTSQQQPQKREGNGDNGLRQFCSGQT